MSGLGGEPMPSVEGAGQVFTARVPVKHNSPGSDAVAPCGAGGEGRAGGAQSHRPANHRA